MEQKLHFILKKVTQHTHKQVTLWRYINFVLLLLLT